MAQATGEIKELLQALMRECFPELNGFQSPIKGKVIKIHESGGMVGDFSKKYSVDVQPLKPDGSVDGDKPVIPDVPIDIQWAGPDRAILNIPPIGTIVRLEFYYWDPSLPFVSGILADGYAIPEHPLGSFIIQQKNGVFIKIQPNGEIKVETNQRIQMKAGKSQIIMEPSGEIEIGPGSLGIGANGEIAIAGGGQAIARIGDSVSCPCGVGTITSGSGKVSCGG